MANDLRRYRVTWAGWPGAPGVSTFYAVSATPGLNASLKTFFGAIKAYLPTSITVTVPSQGDLINDVTGALTGQFGDGTDGTITGTATGGIGLAQGPMVTWKTDGIHNGRHLKGRTFLVPWSTDQWGNNGLMISACQTAVQNAASALVTSMQGGMVVWGRPKAGTGGMSSPITSAVVPTKPCVLRSRRD